MRQQPPVCREATIWTRGLNYRRSGDHSWNRIAEPNCEHKIMFSMPAGGRNWSKTPVEGEVSRDSRNWRGSRGVIMIAGWRIFNAGGCQNIFMKVWSEGPISFIVKKKLKRFTRPPHV